jgi:hypothetical protein
VPEVFLKNLQLPIFLSEFRFAEYSGLASSEERDSCHESLDLEGLS